MERGTETFSNGTEKPIERHKNMNNTPAFPMQPTMAGGEYCEGYDGMTLRDYFAAKAMQGLLANSAWLNTVANQTNNRSDGITLDSVNAARAYSAADAMLKTREATT